MEWQGASSLGMAMAEVEQAAVLAVHLQMADADIC